jgi:hypothetical protein
MNDRYGRRKTDVTEFGRKRAVCFPVSKGAKRTLTSGSGLAASDLVDAGEQRPFFTRRAACFAFVASLLHRAKSKTKHDEALPEEHQQDGGSCGTAISLCCTSYCWAKRAMATGTVAVSREVRRSAMANLCAKELAAELRRKMARYFFHLGWNQGRWPVVRDTVKLGAISWPAENAN